LADVDAVQSLLVEPHPRKLQDVVRIRFEHPGTGPAPHHAPDTLSFQVELEARYGPRRHAATVMACSYPSIELHMLSRLNPAQANSVDIATWHGDRK
jgi:hypothetical protein